MPVAPLPQEKREEIIALWMEGLTERTIASRANVARSTVHGIIKSKDGLAAQKKMGDDMLRRAYVKAARVLEEQLEDKNPWVRQNAARSIVSIVQQQEAAKDNVLTVRFTAMQAPALPSDTPVPADGDVV